ncbi:extracellular solute-binding protein [Pelagibacteraceae bacterium]|nr:extracellular solute-binding protein [Pelagibacteraceae bacterium]
MKNLPILLLSVFLFLLPLQFASAEKVHGIAMHGTPKYSNNFTHLDYVNPNAPKGGTVKFGSYGSFDNLNRVAFKGSKAAGLGYVNDTLMRRVWDEAFSLYGLIAEKVELPEDRSSITFYLNSNATFHDGSPITRDDVLFSLETFQTKGTPNQKKTYGKVVETQLIGNDGIKMIFENNEDKELPLIIAGFLPIIPKKFYENLDVTKTFLDIPLGSGPYQVDSLDPGRQIKYKRVENYWAKDLPVNKGLYNFDTIIYDYYKDSNVLVEAFKVGEYDFRREYNVKRWLSEYDFKAVQNGEVILTEMNNDRPVGMNGLVMNTRRDIFNNRNVRLALSYAYDHEWINKTIYQNAYVRTDSYFDNSPLASSGLPSKNELELLNVWKDEIPAEVFTETFTPPITDGSGNDRKNLLKAKEILEKEGWFVEDGKLVKDGEEFKFEFLIVSPSDEKIALAYQSNLKKLGITMDVRTVDSSQYQERLLSYDFDMIKRYWGVSLSPGNEQQFYWGSEVGQKDGSRNYPGINSPAVDALIEKLISATNREELTTAIHALDRVLLWGHYVVPLYHSNKDRIAYWDFFEYPDEIPLYGIVIESWWINKDKQ